MFQQQQTPEQAAERELGMNAMIQSLMRQRNEAQNLAADREAGLTVLNQKLQTATTALEDAVALIQKMEEENGELVKVARDAIELAKQEQRRKMPQLPAMPPV